MKSHIVLLLVFLPFLGISCSKKNAQTEFSAKVENTLRNENLDALNKLSYFYDVDDYSQKKHLEGRIQLINLLKDKQWTTRILGKQETLSYTEDGYPYNLPLAFAIEILSPSFEKMQVRLAVAEVDGHYVLPILKIPESSKLQMTEQDAAANP